MFPIPPNFMLFLGAAFMLAITPGPGIFYVLARTLKGGRSEGIASAVGTAVGGMGHVLAAALGLSVILATSVLAFALVKYVGAAYLIYLGIKTLHSHHERLEAAEGAAPIATAGPQRAFLQGIVVELLNPKTALFFLAFIPQFINLTGVVFAQFLLLGAIVVLLNTGADFVVVMLAGPIGEQLQRSRRLRTGQRIFTGSGLIALGGYVALTGTHRG